MNTFKKTPDSPGKKHRVIPWRPENASPQEPGSMPKSQPSPSRLWPWLIVSGLVFLVAILLWLKPNVTHQQPEELTEANDMTADHRTEEGKIASQTSAGDDALARGDRETALDIFSQLLATEPDNVVYQRKLQRANTIDRVYLLLQTAQKKEQNGNWQAALEDYKAALALDPLAIDAQEGEFRMLKKLREAQVTALLAEAQALEAQGKWNEALAKYQAVLKVDPEQRSGPAGQAVDNLERKRLEAAVQSGLNKAQTAESNFQWTEAGDAYQGVLDVDPNNEIAKQGVVRVGKIERSLLRYKRALSDAEKLANEGRFQNAIAAFNEAMANKPSHLALTAKTRSLQQALEQQKDPVAVELISNNRTFVVIQGYEAPGYFRREQVSLLPDRYIIQGRRSGYQEVTVDLAVRNGEPIEPVEIICREKE